MLVKGNHKGTDEVLEIEDLRQELAGLRSQYAVGSLANLIETLTEAMEKIAEQPFFDKNLGTALISGITKAISATKQTIDLAPLVAEVSKQNKAILEIMNRKQPANDSSQYPELLKMTLSALAKNSEFMQRLTFAQQSAPPSAPIVPMDKRATEWEFDTVKDKYGNFKTKAKSK